MRNASHRIRAAHIVSGVLAISSMTWSPVIARSAEAEFKLEPGFSLFFNGKDLTGWKLHKGASLDKMTEAPRKRFQVKERKLIIDGEEIEVDKRT